MVVLHGHIDKKTSSQNSTQCKYFSVRTAETPVIAIFLFDEHGFLFDITVEKHSDVAFW